MGYCSGGGGVSITGFVRGVFSVVGRSAVPIVKDNFHEKNIDLRMYCSC